MDLLFLAGSPESKEALQNITVDLVDLGHDVLYLSHKPAKAHWKGNSPEVHLKHILFKKGTFRHFSNLKELSDFFISLPTLTKLKDMKYIIMEPLDDFFSFEETPGNIEQVIFLIATLLNYSKSKGASTVLSVDVENHKFWEVAITKAKELYYYKKDQVINYPENAYDELKQSIIPQV